GGLCRRRRCRRPGRHVEPAGRNAWIDRMPGRESAAACRAVLAAGPLARHRRKAMCIALLANQVHQTYSLIVAANRDEYHARPTAPAAWWSDDILAGRDLLAGGTWFGVRRSGRIALLTNYRDGLSREPEVRSRGELVVAALHSTHAPQRTLADILSAAEDYA